MLVLKGEEPVQYRSLFSIALLGSTVSFSVVLRDSLGDLLTVLLILLQLVDFPLRIPLRF